MKTHQLDISAIHHQTKMSQTNRSFTVSFKKIRCAAPKDFGACEGIFFLHAYWNMSEVQSLVYIMNNSLATKFYIAKIEIFGFLWNESGL